MEEEKQDTVENGVVRQHQPHPSEDNTTLHAANMSASDDDCNAPDGHFEEKKVEPSEDESPEADLDEDDSEEEDSEEDSENDSEEDPLEDLPKTDLVVTPLIKEQPYAGVFPVSSGGFNQRFIPIRYGISANETRSSRLRPSSRHLTIKFPEGLNRLFSGVWVAERADGMVFISLFARSDQDSRTGYKGDCAWKWFRVKDSNEVAIGLSRSYTLSRRDDVLVHDYDVGAFRLHLPHEPSEQGAVKQHSPMFTS